MTDEQIEKWLNDTYRNMSDGYQTSLEHGGKGDPDFEEQINKLGAEIDYINRLKAENASLKDYIKRCENGEEYWVKCLLDRPKEMAKDILQGLLEYGKTLTDNVLTLAKEYGVEVDEQ